MGKKGNPSALNAWAGSLGGVSSALGAVVIDLKAASPYSLGDASFGNQRVTAGTTQVTVGHYSGYMGNPGAPIHKTETKWVTEKVLTSSGVAQNSGSFMTWLPGSVPSFGNTAGTWQGYAASMFATLLQDFVNVIEEIQNTIDQLSKELSALATSISDSRKWWHILLEIVLPIVAVLIGVVVNFLFPGLGAAILGLLSNGLRFLGSIVGIVGESAVEISDIGSVASAEIIDDLGISEPAVDLGAAPGSGEKFSAIFGELGPGSFQTVQVWTVSLPEVTITTADGGIITGDFGEILGEVAAGIPSEFRAIYTYADAIFAMEEQVLEDSASVVSELSVDSSVGWDYSLFQGLPNWLRPIQEIGNWPPPNMLFSEVASEAGPSALYDLPELLPGALDPGAFLSSGDVSSVASVFSGIETVDSGVSELVIPSEVASELSGSTSTGSDIGPLLADNVSESTTEVSDAEFSNFSNESLTELEQATMVNMIVQSPNLYSFAPTISTLSPNMITQIFTQLATRYPATFIMFLYQVPVADLAYLVSLIPEEILNSFPEIEELMTSVLG